MKGDMPRQPKQVKERSEAKLEGRLIRKLESYCLYLDSHRDYVISQALEIAFKKDQGFTDWLNRQPADAVTDTAPALPQRGRKASRAPAPGVTANDAASGPPTATVPSVAKGA